MNPRLAEHIQRCKPFFDALDQAEQHLNANVERAVGLMVVVPLQGDEFMITLAPGTPIERLEAFRHHFDVVLDEMVPGRALQKRLQ